MKPWMTRVESRARAARRQTRWASVSADAWPADRSRLVAESVDVADMGASRFEMASGSIGRGGARVGLEAVALEDRQRSWRTDEREPEPSRVRMRRAVDRGTGIDRGRVLCRRDIDVADRMPGLLLEDRLGLPGHARLGAALHQKQRGLPMMDPGENGTAVGYLGRVDGCRQGLASGLL